jgi:HD-GYP domain-containing protein (c-di-GMP phosphodiesterase class II)
MASTVVAPIVPIASGSHAPLRTSGSGPAVQITTIAEIGVQITAARTISDIMRVLHTNARWLFTMQRCSLALRVPHLHKLRMFVQDRGALNVHQHPLDAVGDGMVAYALDRNVPVRLSSTNPEWRLASIDTTLFVDNAQIVLVLPLIADGEVFGALCFSSTKRDAYPMETIGLGRLIALQISSAVRNALLLEDLDDRESVILSLALAIEAKDPYTEGHCQRLAEYAARLGTLLGFDAKHIAQLRMASILHDVGKIAVPEAILKKDGPLTAEEYILLQQHPVVGETICQPLRSARALLPAIRHHHERWDGRGYPDRLAGTAIPLDARIIAIVDAFDAMTSDRPYRAGMPFEKALNIMRENQGPQWDPDLLAHFIPMIEADLANRHG